MQSPLFRIRDLLRAGESLRAVDIAERLQLPPELVDAGLEHWQSRGQIARLLPLVQSAAGSCQSSCAGGGCARCGQRPSAALTEPRYRWRG